MIVPHLWFDTQAKEAAQFYTSLLPNSKINYINTIHDTPSGDCDTVSFEIDGQAFMAISAGPDFKLNPAISFMVNFDPSQDDNPKEMLSEMWEKLLPGGTVLMDLAKYPFSEWYGWIQDKYGVSWQLMLTRAEGDKRPRIIPAMMFIGDNLGKANEAIEFYTSVFKDGKRGTTAPNPDKTLMFADFHILNTWIAAMDSPGDHKFNFNEAISLIIPCDTQEEIDYYWEKLSAVPESEQCGWLKDTFGVSWQVWPTLIGEVMKNGTREQVDRVTRAFLDMKKFDIATLQNASEGK